MSNKGYVSLCENFVRKVDFFFFNLAEIYNLYKCYFVNNYWEKLCMYMIVFSIVDDVFVCEIMKKQENIVNLKRNNEF